MEQVVTALAPQERGIGRPTNTGTAASQVGNTATVELLVGFEGDTHRLTVEGMKTLRMFATALNDPRLQGARLQIVAHTYLPNAPTSALPVSARRAQSVADHLLAFYDIQPAQIAATNGVGAAQINVGNLADPMNQRIAITNIGSL
ncbi:MAG: OmpA family protein [Pseudomonadota bacterium]